MTGSATDVTGASGAGMVMRAQPYTDETMEYSPRKINARVVYACIYYIFAGECVRRCGAKRTAGIVQLPQYYCNYSSFLSTRIVFDGRAIRAHGRIGGFVHIPAKYPARGMDFP